MVAATCYKCGKESYVEFEAAGIDAASLKYVFDCGCTFDNWQAAMDEVAERVAAGNTPYRCPHCHREECSH